MLSRVLSASQRQTKALLSQLCEAQLLRPLDLAFGEFIASLDANTADMDDAAHLDITMLAAYLSNRLGEQHSCLDLNTLQQPFAPIFYSAISRNCAVPWCNLPQFGCVKRATVLFKM